MADFVDNGKDEGSSGPAMIDASKPLEVLYCGVCSMPPEFCEFGTCYDQCLPWILANCPEVVGDADAVAAAMSKLSVGSGKVAAGAEGDAPSEGAETEEVSHVLQVTLAAKGSAIS
jgi:hypothetical protein